VSPPRGLELKLSIDGSTEQGPTTHS
jgi:hypothetical protein